MQCRGPKNGKPNAPQDKGLHCIVCKYRQFKTEQGLSDHFKRQHSIFPCPDCDNIYAATDELAVHRYEAHDKGGLKNKRCLRDSDHLPAPKGKPASRPRAASSPAIAEVHEQLCLPPSRPRSTSHAESRGPLAHGCHQTVLVPQPPNQVPRETEQVHAAPRTAHVFRPQAPVFVPRGSHPSMGFDPLAPPTQFLYHPVRVYQVPVWGYHSQVGWGWVWGWVY